MARPSQWLFALVLCVVISSPAASPASDRGAIRVEGTGSPEVDVRSLTEAIDAAPPGGIVLLSGRFDLSLCATCLVIRKHLTLQGVDGAELVGGLAPLIVSLDPHDHPQADHQGRRNSSLVIRGLTFREQTLLAIGLGNTHGTVRIEQNGFFDIYPFLPFVTEVPEGVATPSSAHDELVAALSGALNGPEPLVASLREVLAVRPNLAGSLRLGRPGVSVAILVQALAGQDPEVARAVVEALRDNPELVQALFEVLAEHPELIEALLLALGLEPEALVWRFAIGSYDGSIALDPPLRIEGDVFIERNVIDFLSGDAAFMQGDDNGIAFSTTSLRRVVVRHNFVATTGEGIELQGNIGPPDAAYEIVGNTVVTDTFPSALGRITKGPAGSAGSEDRGGHPGAIKMVASNGTFRIRGNRISVFGSEDFQIGSCIVAGTLHPEALQGTIVNVIEHNECQLDRQFAAITGGSANIIGFFDASWLSGTRVWNNTIAGTAKFGFALVDRIVEFPSFTNEPNSALGTLILDNDVSGFRASEATLVFGPSTQRNTYRGRLDGTEVDQGTWNEIHPPTPRGKSP